MHKSNCKISAEYSNVRILSRSTATSFYCFPLHLLTELFTARSLFESLKGATTKYSHKRMASFQIFYTGDHFLPTIKL